MSLVAAPFAILWPAAIVVALLDGRRRAVGWSSVAVLAAVLLVLTVLTVRAADGDPQEMVAGGWPVDVGIRLRLDGMGALFALASCLVLLLALAREVRVGPRARSVPALTLLLALGLTGLFATGDIFSFYVFFELAMISAYALTAAGGRAREQGAAFIFAVVNLLGSFLFLIAVAAVYRVTGTLEMDAVAAATARLEPNTAILIAITFFVAFGVKLGLFPFHFWLPAVYGSVTAGVAAMLAGAVANIGAYGLLRFGAELLPREVELAGTALIVLGAASVAYGALQAIGRTSTREVLAYSAIGNAGYVLVALGLGSEVGLAAAIVFSVFNALNKALLFLAADLRGPLVGFAFLVGALSVAGVPPAAGFFGKAALLDAAVVADDVAVVALLFVGSALTFVYLFQAFQRDHWRPPGDGAPARAAPHFQRLLVAGCAVLVLAIGLWPEPLLSAGDRAAAEVTGRVAP